MILTGQLQLTNKQTVATDTLKLCFNLAELKTLNGEPHPSTFNFTPGQFVSIGFGPKAWRAYSIASTPAEPEIELLVRLVDGGVGSEAFRDAQLGHQFEFKGPFGEFKLSANPDAHLVFCATGTGIAPFRSLIKTEAQSKNPRPMTLLYGGKNAADLGYLKELQDWSPSLNIQLGLSRDPKLVLPSGLNYSAQNCRITTLIEQLPPSKNHEFYLCGNGAMVKSVQGILQGLEVSPERILTERFN